MTLTANPKIVEELMRIFRKEGARRQLGLKVGSGRANGFVNTLSSAPLNDYMNSVNLTRPATRVPDLPVKTSYVVSDFLNFHDEAFIQNAYMGILHREPDITGRLHYLDALRSGRYTKAEILGRLRYSMEGKEHAVRVSGLFIPFLFQMTYRIPVLGYALAWVNFILRLPSIVRNWSRFEAFVAFQNHEQRQWLNQLVDQTEQTLRQVGSRCEQKADREELGDLRITLEDKAPLSSLQQALVELRAKADQSQIAEIQEHLVGKADINQLSNIEADLLVLREDAEDLLRQIRNKADKGPFTDLVQAVEDKAGRADLEDIRHQVLQNLEAKVDRVDLDEMRHQVHQNLEAKVDRTELDEINHRFDSKADIQLIENWNVRLETRADTEQLAKLADSIDINERKTVASINEIRRQVIDHKRNIIDQQRRLGLLLEEARKHLAKPNNPERIKRLVAEEDHLLDAFYVSFEDCFRGTREDIKQRMEIYLPIIKEIQIGHEDAPILDIGCGRGEWLELLKTEGLMASGVDLNRIMVEQCRELGLEIIEADALDYLRNLKSNSLGAVTGMHIIEHIPFKRLIALLDEVIRILKPGGVAIFETPNPENLITGACNFYYDPTHLNPLPPDSMRFVMEIRGFNRIEIMRLHPHNEEMMLKEGPPQIRQIINERFFGAQDYALVAYKV